jgi:hypothetical protein
MVAVVFVSLWGSVSGSRAQSPDLSLSLSGVTFKSGLKQSRSTAPQAIVAAKEYDYLISGTCHGTNLFAFTVPPGTKIADAIEQVDPGGSKILSGSIFDLESKLPFLVTKSSIKGSNVIFGIHVSAAGSVKVSLSKQGVLTTALSGVQFKLNGKPDKTDSLVLDANAACDLTAVTSGTAASAQPDAMLIGQGFRAIGNDVYNTDGTDQKQSFTIGNHKSSTFVALVQNDGPTADTITLSGSSSVSGFLIKYLDAGNNDITAAVTAGTFSTGSLASGDFGLIKIKITVNGAPSGAKVNALLTATSSANPQDVISAEVIAK